MPETDTPPSAADIAVLIVNYGTAALTLQAVESVRSSDHGGRRVEIHLVDNASPEGQDARILTQAHAERGWGDMVTLYLETENHGFGRGNNVALAPLLARATPPKYIFLLNPDARLANEAIGLLAEALDAQPQMGFAGAAMMNDDGTPITAAFRFPKPLSEFSRQLAFGPLARLVPSWTVPLPPDHPAGPVDWVTGAAVMMRRETLTEIGIFDPGYFLYYEELDLMQRGAKAGWGSLFVPQAKVFHAEGAATQIKVSTRRPAYWYRSWRKYFHDHYGPIGVRLAALAWTVGGLGNHLLALIIPHRGRSTPDRFFRDLWALVWRPLLGLNEGRRV